MTYDDSVQIAAMSPRPAPACMRRGGKASGLETMRNVLVSGGRRTPVARKPVSALRPTAKFSALQSLENAQNAERISILRERVPRGRRNIPRRRAKGARAIARATALEGSNRPGRKLQKKAPKALKSFDAEMKSAPRCAPRTHRENVAALAKRGRRRAPRDLWSGAVDKFAPDCRSVVMSS
jgi:hypothetical protein